MATQKSQSPPHYSVNALSKMTGRDRRTIDKVIASLPPASMDGSTKRYRLEDVQAALAAKPDRSLRDEKLAEEIRKLRIRNDREESKLLQIETAREIIGKVLARVDQIIEQKLANEYPSAVAGLDVPQARVYGKRLGDQIRVEFQSLSSLWA